MGAELSPASVVALRRMAKEAGPMVQRRVNKALRAGAMAGSEAAKKTVLGPPPPKADQRTKAERVFRARARYGGNRGHTGLRAGIAKGTRVALGSKLGIRIVSTSTYLPTNQKGMNRVYRNKTFRHPVFGNKRAWANQHGLDWFYGPINRTVPAIRVGLDVAMKLAAEEISKGV